MQNPIRMLPMFNPEVPGGTFRHAFFKGAGTGALMMGIFTTVASVAAIIGLMHPIGLLYGLTSICVGGMSTGLFSGIMATQRAAETARTEVALDTAPRREREPVMAPEHALAAERTTNWQASVGDRRDRIASILENGSLSDADRASAILKAREQSNSSETAR